MNKNLPACWQHVLSDEFRKPYFQELNAFLEAERQTHTVFPREEDVFNALRWTPLGDVRVVLLGQDPYHNDGQAHGLCFPVPPGVKPPPSLVNILKELHSDLGCRIPNNGCLAPWARHGVLLLNAVLTVRAHRPNSHQGRGWEQFTDAVIRAVSDRPRPAVFALWGNAAQKKGKVVDAARHRLIQAAHPSPLSAAKFRGSRPFSAINQNLRDLGRKPINWQLPEV